MACLRSASSTGCEGSRSPFATSHAWSVFGSLSSSSPGIKSTVLTNAWTSPSSPVAFSRSGIVCQSTHNRKTVNIGYTNLRKDLESYRRWRDEPVCQRRGDVAAAEGRPAGSREPAPDGTRAIPSGCGVDAGQASLDAGSAGAATRFPGACRRTAVRVRRRLAPSRSLPGHRAPAEDRREQHDLSHEDDPVDVDGGYPRHVGTLDHEGARRSRIEADPGPARLAGV